MDKIVKAQNQAAKFARLNKCNKIIFCSFGGNGVFYIYKGGKIIQSMWVE